jgi:SAM-dependent MidA family methyltransferase
LERESLIDVVRERGPMTVAAFMDLALYHPGFGYYARAPKRSGRAGDFFTSVDVGALFGELLEIQIAEMADILADGGKDLGRSPNVRADLGRSQNVMADPGQSPNVRPDLGQSPNVRADHGWRPNVGADLGRPSDWLTNAASPTPPRPDESFHLVEAGAGNGQLSADILRAARTRDPHIYSRLHLHLVERSPEARAAQQAVLGDAVSRLKSAGPRMPEAFEGVVVANELLDALPVHQVVMREEGLREVYVEAGGGLSIREGAVSTVALAEYLDRLDVALEPGWRAEINLHAVQWVRETAGRLKRGFVILIDYGHEARELYSVTHAGGTLTTFSRHTGSGAESAGGNPPWLDRPGEHDMTAHVDFTSVREAAEAEGLVTLGFLDQTYFLLGLSDLGSAGSTGADFASLKKRLALKTLLMPGGLGSTMKVLILGKGVGTPSLRGCSYRMRVT